MARAEKPWPRSGGCGSYDGEGEMKRVDSITDRMRGIVTYEFDNGQRIAFDERALRKAGITEMLRRYGIKQQHERVGVFQGGRQIGTVPSYFDPLFAKSTSFLYDARPGDFTRTDRGWEAVPQLGPGDFEAIPEFRWDDDDIEAGRAKRAEDERDLLRKVVTGKSAA